MALPLALERPAPVLASVPFRPFEDFRKRKVFGSLDGLRALSILAVVWHHASRGHGFPWEQGAMGVPLFFAISGFLITTLLLRERERHGRISLSAFYARRSLRIFPLYYAVIGLYTGLVLLLEGSSPAGRGFLDHLPAFATYTSNWFVALPQPGERVLFYFAWSLATEEQFYLLWPSIENALAGKRHLPVWIAGGMVALWAAVALGLLPLAAGSLPRAMVLSIAPAICMGVMLAHALHSPVGFRRLFGLLHGRWAGAIYAAATLALLATTRGPLAHLADYAVMTLLVGACVVREDHALARPLRLRPLVHLGQVSYGVYLLHMLSLNGTERLLAPLGITARGIVYPITVLVAWGLAWVSFHFYESRWLALKTRFLR